MSLVSQEQLDRLEVEIIDTGVLRAEDATNVRAISTFVPPNQETRLISAAAVTQIVQSLSGQGKRSDVMERLGRAPAGRKIQPRRRLGPLNPTHAVSGSSRSEVMATREERCPDRSPLMWSRPVPFL